jgi:hypothetical protein
MILVAPQYGVCKCRDGAMEATAVSEWFVAPSYPGLQDQLGANRCYNYDYYSVKSAIFATDLALQTRAQTRRSTRVYN